MKNHRIYISPLIILHRFMRKDNLIYLIIIILVIDILLGFYTSKYTYRIKKESWSFNGKKEITCLSISSSGRFIAMGSIDGAISLIKIGSTSPLWTYQGNISIISTMLSGDGAFLAALDKDCRLYLFSRIPPKGEHVKPRWILDFSTCKLEDIYSSTGPFPLVYVLASNRDEVYLISEDGKIVWKYFEPADDIVADLSTDGLFVAVGSSNGKIHLFRVGAGKPLWSYATNSSIESIAISYDNEYIVAGGNTGEGKGFIYLISKNGAMIFNLEVNFPIKSVYISYNGRWIVVHQMNEIITIIDVNREKLRTISFSTPIRLVDLSPFGPYLIVSNSKGEVYLYYLPRPAPLWRFKTSHKDPLIEINPKGDHIVVSDFSRVHLLLNTSLSEMIPGSRILWASIFFTSLIALILFIGKAAPNILYLDSGSIFNSLISFLFAALIGFYIFKDFYKALLPCGIGSAVASLIFSRRGGKLLALIAGSYIGLFSSGIAGFLLGHLIWFTGAESNIIQLLMINTFEGFKMGVLFGPLGSIISFIFNMFRKDCETM